MVNSSKIILLISILCGVFNENSYCQTPDTLIYTFVDSFPSFEYKNCKDLKESVNLYLSEHLEWPSDDDVIGNVYIQLVVEKDGTLTNFKILRSLHEKFDSASIAGLKKMPKWKPGKIKGNVVRTQMFVPVKWVLK